MKSQRKRKLILISALLLATFGLVFSSGPQPVVYAIGNDCDLARQLCNDTSAGLYNLCIALGGDASQCSQQEAENRISCMVNAGCPLHD